MSHSKTLKSLVTHLPQMQILHIDLFFLFRTKADTTGHSSKLTSNVTSQAVKLRVKELWTSSMYLTSMHFFMYRLFNLLKPTGYVMHQQSNIQQLYVLPTLYLCVLYLSENKQRLVPLTA